MATIEDGSTSAGRAALGAVLSLWILGCSGVPAPPEEPQGAAPPASAAAAVVPPAGPDPMETFKVLLSDRRAKPAMLGAGGLLAAVLLAVGIGKVLRGDSAEAHPANNGSGRGA